MPFMLRTVAAAGVLGSTMANTCTLPSETGLCKAAITKWFHNAQSGQCETFVYGGCGGNDNKFDSQAACQAECPPEPDTCTLPAVTGPCRAHMPKWFHNAQSGQCEEFVYGGCEGNANRFDNQAACDAACPPEPDMCTLPSETGPCRAHMPKWFHNAQSGQCEEFIYGGCEGNANRFDNQAACNAACSAPSQTPVSQAPVSQAPVSQAPVSQAPVSQAPVSQAPVSQAPTQPTCQQPMVVGPCRAAVPSWYFNMQTSECEQFIYGGCQGNDNRFASEEACQDQCAPPTLPPPTPVCEQPMVVGPCRASVPSWYHDNTGNGRCRRFTYGGCQGNENRFASRRACNKACTRDECALPAETGPCRAHFQMWFFNRDSRQCEQFVYGGCGGNGNQFETENACNNRCGQSLLAAGRPAESEGAKGGLSAGAVAGIGGGAGALVAASIAACMVVARKRSEEPSIAAAEEQLKGAADV